jgi:hypothetical protein
VLGHPTFVARLYGRDAQGVTLLRQQRIAAVARAIRPDLARFGKMADVLVLGVAAPGAVGLIGGKRESDGVQSAHKIAIFAESLEHAAADSGHDVHAGDNVGGVGDLHSDS